MKYLETQFVLLIQYLPSLCFSELNPKTYETLFDISQASGRERMIDIGRTLAIDSFLNFPLRFPLLWKTSKTKGLENILFELKDNSQEIIGNLFLLNTHCYCFTNGNAPHAMRVDYLNTVEQFICDVFKDCKMVMQGKTDITTYEFESLKKIKDFLINHCKIEGVICLEIVFGIIIGFYNIVNMGKERIEKTLNQTKQLAILENKEEWEKQRAESISMTYIYEAYDLIDHHLRLHLDEILWVLKISNNYKVILKFAPDKEEEVLLEIDDDFIL